MDTTVHPYFTEKAEAVFRKAAGDPARSGQLAAWAQAAHADGPDTRRRVLVAEDGTVVAEARYSANRVGATYVTSVTNARDTDLVDREVGLAAGSLSRRYGQPVIVVTYSEVCTGQSTHSRDRRA